MALSRPAALVALHVAVLLFGFAGLFGKWLALPAVAIVLGRTVIAAAALALVVRSRGESVRPSAPLALNGLILAVHWVAFFHAIQLANVAVGLLGFASFPLFVLLLEHALVRRPLSLLEAATASAVTLGLVVLLPSFDWRDRSVQGLAFGVLSGFTFALLAVRGRALVPLHAASRIALWQNAFAALALLPFAAAEKAWLSLTARDAALLLVLGLACTALAHTLFIASMQRVSAHAASVVAALEPVYGIALAMLLLGEVPGVRTLVGAALIVGAAIAASRRPAG